MNVENESQPHVLIRLQERYPSCPWSYGDVKEIESAIRENQMVFYAEADPGYRVCCVRYGHPQPLLLVVDTLRGRLITALPPKDRPRWAGRAYLQKTATRPIVPR